MLAQQVDRRLVGFAQRIKSAGKQHRDRARRRHRRRAGFVEMFEMIGRQRMEARGERGAVLVGQLLGMEADRQAVRGRGLEQALGLRRGEGDALAESIDDVARPSRATVGSSSTIIRST